MDKKPAVLVIDLQEVIARPRSAKDPRHRVLAASQAVIRQARLQSVPVIFTKTVSRPDHKGSITAVIDRDRRQPSSPAQWDFGEILPELGPLAHDIVVSKFQWSPFYGSPLEMFLRRLEVNTLLLMGIPTNLAVESTARDAYDRNYHCIAIADAMMGTTPEEHRFSLTYVYPRISRVMNSTGIIAWLAAKH
ncbi:MAG: hypothetical protein C7B43_03160 [Sulfobacillus benefaciens]|uniref:Isochorismatase-like domain-containing protein n=1 Tax=Sulfobacillus benefaciens TaxID=453960 RepID=A0A2T2X9B9_9FIRM|nr:MAG: hypothetical protein C7B43_03160 [Sulfobacillus benefaciens]